MEYIIKVDTAYNSLDSLCSFLNAASPYECVKDYDIWEVRTASNGQIEQCIILKKNKMHAVKLYFINENKIKVDYIIPSKIMNAYFGKQPRIRQNILELVTTKIKEAILASPQQKAFEELTSEVRKAAV